MPKRFEETSYGDYLLKLAGTGITADELVYISENGPVNGKENDEWIASGKAIAEARVA